MEVKELATSIVQRLVDHGYIAYFAGGWVRDFLMQHPSADIDIATSAPPDKIVELFPRTVQVGISFGVVVVILNHHQFEVSTFRTDLEYIDGRRPMGIEHSSPEEDALRRDFTINGLFFDPLQEKLIDYIDGVRDIERGIIRTIGDPGERFAEDRLRMIRAVRFAARFQFAIDEKTKEAIINQAHTLIPSVAMERIWQEFTKMTEHAHIDHAVRMMHQLGLLQTIFPKYSHLTAEEIKELTFAFHLFPKECPAIVYLMELFSGAHKKELIDICRYLRTRNRDMRTIDFMYRGRGLLKQEEEDNSKIDLAEWVHFYAHHLSQLCINVFAARFPYEKREAFILHHDSRRRKLHDHINRVLYRKPVVNATYLQEHGVKPGIHMGELLDEAENLAIVNNLHEPQEVMMLLKQSPIWKKVYQE